MHLRDGSEVTEETLREHCRGLIASYKVPKRVLVVDEVPRTPVSKVDYPASSQRALELLAAR